MASPSMTTCRRLAIFKPVDERGQGRAAAVDVADGEDAGHGARRVKGSGGDEERGRLAAVKLAELLRLGEESINGCLALEMDVGV